LRSYPKRARKIIGRAVEVAQWGQTDTTARRMKGKLRDVFEVRADGPGSDTYRAMYYPTRDPDGPIAVLHVFRKKSTRGIATPQRDLAVIELRLKRVKEVDGG
jgi:phage-related protein